MLVKDGVEFLALHGATPNPVWRGTSKWFGNAYGSLRGWMNNMTKKSRDKWDSISSTAWSNAKSVWRGTSKWFSNAYGSLKGWMNNMSKKLMINGITFHPLHGAMLNRFGEALKWFGNAYGSLKSWTGKMADKAHDRFDKISSDAWVTPNLYITDSINGYLEL